jgi:hypothetical protein
MTERDIQKSCIGNGTVSSTETSRFISDTELKKFQVDCLKKENHIDMDGMDYEVSPGRG